MREDTASYKKACKINLDENVLDVYDMRIDERGNFSRLASGYCKNNTYIKEVALIKVTLIICCNTTHR